MGCGSTQKRFENAERSRHNAKLQRSFTVDVDVKLSTLSFAVYLEVCSFALARRDQTVTVRRDRRTHLHCMLHWAAYIIHTPMSRLYKAHNVTRRISRIAQSYPCKRSDLSNHVLEQSHCSKTTTNTMRWGHFKSNGEWQTIKPIKTILGL